MKSYRIKLVHEVVVKAFSEEQALDVATQDLIESLSDNTIEPTIEEVGE